MKKREWVAILVMTAEVSACHPHGVQSQDGAGLMAAKSSRELLSEVGDARRYRKGHLSIALPPGWSAPSSAGSVLLRSERTDGAFIEIIDCPETEVDSDVNWEVQADASGRGVARIVESSACTSRSKEQCLSDASRAGDPEAAGLACEECSAGDGRLDIWGAFNGVRVSPGGVCFHVGNSRREDADRVELREIVKTFKVEPQ